MLQGKHIILGITGGIAAYKSVTLARLLVKAGAEVQVIMTPNAREFVAPLTFSTVTSKPVITEFFTANTGQWNSHVDLGVWADAMIVAPATASTIAKMVTGVADNMLVTTYLSARAPVFIAPAMDLDMMAHPSTQHNLKVLASRGVHIIEAATGELASHLVGKGRMEEPERIVAVLEQHFAAGLTLKDRRVLITAGPTRERIDPVRFISNFSSGKMGFALANECARRGAHVTLVAGPVALGTPHPAIDRVDVESAVEMHDAVMKYLSEQDAVILCAAVADYRVEHVSDTKIKHSGHTPPTLTLVENPDIARAVGQAKTDRQVTVGFALETDHEMDNAHKKMQSKNLDMIVLNSLNDPGAGFMVDTNKVTMILANETIECPCKSKTEVASDIIDQLTTLLNNRK